MGRKTSIDVDSGRPTYAADFIKHDIEEAVFLGHPVLDNLVNVVLALSAEVWANRRRGRIVEALLKEQGITAEMIENYMPSAEDEAEWDADRARFVKATLRPLMRNGNLPINTDYDDKS